MLKNNKVVMALSLLFAIAIWMYVIGVEDPSTTRSFANEKIQIVNEQEVEEYGYSVTELSDREVSLRIRAPRSVMTSIKNGNLQVYVKIKEIKTGSQVLDVKAKLPSSAKLISIDPESITVKLKENTDETGNSVNNDM